MNNTTKKFKVKGMHCQNCENSIKIDVSKINGIKEIIVDYVKVRMFS